MTTNSNTAIMPDVQNSVDSRNLAIDKVGIKGLRHPFQLVDALGTHATVGVFNMYVHLPAHLKGTHMSRFIEVLSDQHAPLSLQAFENMVRNVAHKLESDTAYVEMTFPYFVNKAAPVSGVSSLLDYEVTWVGELKAGQYQATLKAVVPVTSLCPCSKKISDYGAHNQRSHLTLTADIAHNDFAVVELIHIAEKQASCELFGILKRPDEKWVTERAYDNPKFVEDLIRDVATQMEAHPAILSYIVESENFESIHNHSAYALIQRNKR